jgi:hypothetical protein
MSQNSCSSKRSQSTLSTNKTAEKDKTAIVAKTAKTATVACFVSAFRYACKIFRKLNVSVPSKSTFS